MGSYGKFSRAFFVAVAVDNAISGEVSDFAVGLFIALTIGVPEVSGRFIDVYVFNSQFRGAKNAIVSSLLTL